MILVTVGTTDFDALVERMDAIAADLAEDVVAQVGRGRYTPRHMSHFRFAPDLGPYYDRARLVVAHGGVGTTLEVLDRGLKLITLSNPDRFDDHQDDLLRALERQNYLVWCRDLDDLPSALRQAEEQEFVRYRKPECDIASIVRRHLRLPPQVSSSDG